MRLNIGDGSDCRVHSHICVQAAAVHVMVYVTSLSEDAVVS